MQAQGEAEVRISSSSVGLMLVRFQRRLDRKCSCQGQSWPITRSHPWKTGERTVAFSVETRESSEECRRVQDMWRSVATRPPVVEIKAVRSCICAETDGSDGYNAPAKETSPHRRQNRQNLASKSPCYNKSVQHLYQRRIPSMSNDLRFKSIKASSTDGPTCHPHPPPPNPSPLTPPTPPR